MFCRKLTTIVVTVAFLFSDFGTVPSWGYTQSVGTDLSFVVPMGHEWVTRMAAIELLGYKPEIPDVPDPNDPRKGWTQGLAKNLDIADRGSQAEVTRIKFQPYNDRRYASRYKAVYDVIVGERWVDLAGYSVVEPVAARRPCWGAVAQEAEEIQYDHFMRKTADINAVGGVNAASTSQQRFINYFIAAATAPQTTMSVYDGGAGLSAAVDVDRNYFLFGRAAHLFEDSFSPEHTVRIDKDNYTRVRQVKSYLCAAGSEVHTHSKGSIIDYVSGDVIWKKDAPRDPSWASYKASNMKDGALVATEATKDLWAAFIRTMGTPMADRPAKAADEAQKLVNNWLSYDTQEMTDWYNDESHRGDSYVLAEGQSGKGKSVQQCMIDEEISPPDQQQYLAISRAQQRACIYNATPWPGYEDLADPQMNMYFSWQWLTAGFAAPPPEYQIPQLRADTGVRVRIKSVQNQQYMTAPDGLNADAWVYAKPGAPLDFILVGPKEQGRLRATYAPLLFLSYTAGTGAVKLWKPGTLNPTVYNIAPAGPGWSLRTKGVLKDYYMYLYDRYQSPYVDGNGNPSNPNGQWLIEGLNR